MSRGLARALMFCASALTLVLISPMPVRAGHCGCFHQGKEVECPPGLARGAYSSQFVPGGSLWGLPTGGTVFVPQTTFKLCHPPTSTAPAPPSPPVGATPPSPQPPAPPTTSGPPKPADPLPREPPPLVPPPQTMEDPAHEKQVDDAIRRLGELLPKEPPKPQSICGPDVTRLVLGVLKRMRDEFGVAPEAKQKDACEALVSTKRAPEPFGGGRGPMLGEYAWDILELFQGSGAFPEKGGKGVPSEWEKRTGGQCCNPRYPCGPTVEFFGTCHNQQVVNYVMWGMTRNLCSRFTGINAQQTVTHSARNRSSPNKPEQDVMIAVGEKYAEDLPAVEGSFKQYEQSMLSEDVKRLRDQAATNPFRFPDLQKILTDAEATSTRDYKQCATACPVRIPEFSLNYRWIGLTQPLPEGLSLSGR